MELEEARSTVASATGEKVAEIRRVENKSSIFEVVLATSGRKAVLKTRGTFEPGRIALEAWAYRKVKELGIPAPEILFLHAERGDPNEYLLMERVPGEPLGRVDLPTDQKLDLIRETGEHMRAWNAVELDRYGWADHEHFINTGKVRGKDERWCPTVEVALNEGLGYLEKEKALDRAQAMRIRGYLEEHYELLSTSPRKAFLHGDFDTSHVNVDGGKISGYIDFADLQSGDPLFDIARFAFFEPRPHIEALLDGYGAPDADNAEERITGYKLSYGILSSYWYSLYGLGAAEFVLEYSGIPQFDGTPASINTHI